MGKKAKCFLFIKLHIEQNRIIFNASMVWYYTKILPVIRGLFISLGTTGIMFNNMQAEHNCTNSPQSLSQHVSTQMHQLSNIL